MVNLFAIEHGADASKPSRTRWRIGKVTELPGWTLYPGPSHNISRRSFDGPQNNPRLKFTDDLHQRAVYTRKVDTFAERGFSRPNLRNLIANLLNPASVEDSFGLLGAALDRDPTRTMAQCSTCSQPLTLQIELEDEVIAAAGSSSQSQIQEVPDDVQLLACGCHFHWQCLLDAYEMTRCPHCSVDVSASDPNGIPQILCNVRNEGGLQEGLDVFPVLSEELYLRAYPDDRKPRAFLEFCREGDVEAIVDLLKATEEDDDDEEDKTEEEGGGVQLDVSSILRYQDPIGEMRSALHIAVMGGKVEVVWLLLLLASGLEPHHFPSEVKTAAEQLEISREDQTGKADIRTLRDSDEKSAADYARSDLGIDPKLLLITA